MFSDDTVTTKQEKKQPADARRKEFANVIVCDERALKPVWFALEAARRDALQVYARFDSTRTATDQVSLRRE